MWQFFKDKLYYYLAYSLTNFVSLLPREFAINLGVFLGDIYFWIACNDRKRAIKQIGISLRISNNRKKNALTRYCFRNIGKNLVEFMAFPKLNPKAINKFVSFEGKEHLDNALKSGKGVILFTAHFGNWELLAASLSLNGYPMNAIVRKNRSKSLDKLIKSHRDIVGITSIDRDKSIKTALKCLRRNELLGILADIDTKTSGIFVDFFGRLAYTPYGPVAISLKTGAYLIPTFIVRQNDDSHRVFFEPPLKLSQSGDWDTDIKINTSLFTKVIESYIRRYPKQWIWMHQRWKTRP